MKKKIFISLGVVAGVLVLGVLYLVFGPKASPAKTTSFNNSGLDISVSYSQPYKKGRLIFGSAEDKALQPYGKYWRLGANAATEITFSKNVTFAGKPVNAGTYRMYAVPGPTSFQVSLNSELGVYFGVNEPDYTKDVLKVDVPTAVNPTEVEQFVIELSADGATTNMDFMWDKVVVRVPITVQ